VAAFSPSDSGLAPASPVAHRPPPFPLLSSSTLHSACLLLASLTLSPSSHLHRNCPLNLTLSHLYHFTDCRLLPCLNISFLSPVLSIILLILSSVPTSSVSAFTTSRLLRPLANHLDPLVHIACVIHSTPSVVATARRPLTLSFTPSDY
jgi:hypothetical protein